MPSIRATPSLVLPNIEIPEEVPVSPHLSNLSTTAISERIRHFKTSEKKGFAELGLPPSMNSLFVLRESDIESIRDHLIDTEVMDKEKEDILEWLSDNRTNLIDNSVLAGYYLQKLIGDVLIDAGVAEKAVTQLSACGVLCPKKYRNSTDMVRIRKAPQGSLISFCSLSTLMKKLISKD